jgi:hypothetical protein
MRGTPDEDALPAQPDLNARVTELFGLLEDLLVDRACTRTARDGPVGRDLAEHAVQQLWLRVLEHQGALLARYDPDRGSWEDFLARHARCWLRRELAR